MDLTMSIVRQFRPRSHKTLLHGYRGTMAGWEKMKFYVDFPRLSFDPNVMDFVEAEKQTVISLPDSAVLVESAAPFYGFPPGSEKELESPLTGDLISHPLGVKNVVEWVARLRKQPVTQLAYITANNAKEFYDLPNHIFTDRFDEE